MTDAQKLAKEIEKRGLAAITIDTLALVHASLSARPEALPKQEPLPVLRQRFESWFDMAYPLFRDGAGRDTTIKHQLWTAWQVAHLGAPVSPQEPPK